MEGSSGVVGIKQSYCDDVGSGDGITSKEMDHRLGIFAGK